MNNSTAVVNGVTYGQWALDNPVCAAQIGGTDFQVLILQLSWSIINACQTFFFATRYPDVGWENIFVPFVEAVVYGLGYSGIGYVRLHDGRIIVLARSILWFLTAPVLLMQVGNMAKVHYCGFEMNSMQVSAAQVMVVFGLAASVLISPTVKWICFVLACVCLILIGLVSYYILSDAVSRFRQQGSPEAIEVSNRIAIMGYIMLVSWLVHPILYVVSPEGVCAASESVATVAFIVADFFSKNSFQVLYWQTLFRRLSGAWTVNSLKEAVVIPRQAIPTIAVNAPNDESRAPAPAFAPAPTPAPAIASAESSPETRKEADQPVTLQVTADVIDRRKASVAEKRASEGRVSRERSRRREESSDSEADVDFRLDPRDNTFRDVSLLPHTPSLSLVPAPWQKSPVGNSARRLASELGSVLGSERKGKLATRGELSLEGLRGRGEAMEVLGLSRQRARIGAGVGVGGGEAAEEAGDVFEHVRSLNDALSSLLVNEGNGEALDGSLDKEMRARAMESGQGWAKRRNSGGLGTGTGLLDRGGGLLTTAGLDGNGGVYSSALGRTSLQGLTEV